jgi:P2-related tail formation protein
MSIFKEYFFKTLRWPLIHNVGPLAALVEGLARAMDEVRGDIIWLRDQFNPWTCDAGMIVKHAESRGISRHPSESEEGYRERCIRAFAWHRLGGGQLGMPQILAHFGYPGTEILNVRQEDPERWAEFKPQVPIPDSGLHADDFPHIGWIANETKPARSKLAGICVTSSVQGATHAGGIIYTTQYSQLLPQPVTAITLDSHVHGGGYLHTVGRISI